jgi:cobalt/nickel transport system ATP-binding protein
MIDFLADCRGKKTVVAATHALDIVPDVAGRCAVLDAGRLAADGSPEQILEDGALLRRTGLVHAHRHAHPSGIVHSHPHRHGSTGTDHVHDDPDRREGEGS